MKQPDYARQHLLVYHYNRDVKLECDTNLITQDALLDFYSTKVRMFPNLGRELEVSDEPE